MIKIETDTSGQDERLLHEDELNLVSGGSTVLEEKPVSRLVIYGFNPQPDPPGRLVGY
jgi:hypothetical protein